MFDKPINYRVEIERIRREKGMTKKDLAAVSGLPINTIHSVITGRNGTSFERVQQILLALEYEVDFHPVEGEL